jgi:hypothetical protein
MEKVNKNNKRSIAKASSVVALSGIEQSLKGIETDATKDFKKNIGALDLIAKLESAEADNQRKDVGTSESVVSELTASPASLEDVQIVECSDKIEEDEEKNPLECWLEKVRTSEKFESSHYTHLNIDIADVILKVRKATGIPQKHLINYILLDWIKDNSVYLKELFNAKKNKLLTDI